MEKQNLNPEALPALHLIVKTSIPFLKEIASQCKGEYKEQMEELVKFSEESVKLAEAE